MTLQEILQQCGVAYAESGNHHTRSGWLQIQGCPFCSSQNYHLGYNLAQSYWNCWRCGYHSPQSTLRALGVPAALAKELEVDYSVKTQEAVRTGLKEPSYRGDLDNPHWNYLIRERGFDPKKIQKLWQVEGIGIAPRLAWRLYIPILFQGKRVSWTTRSIASDAKQRYISASASEEAINHRHLLYGLDYVRDSVIVLEGPLDVWNVGPGAVGLFGIDYSAAQVRQLAEIPNRTICFDSEPAAINQATKLAEELSCFPGHTQLVVLEAEDPGSASKKEVAELRAAAGLD